MPFLGITEMTGVEHEPGKGFFVNYAAATLVVTLLLVVGGVLISDHNTLGRLEDRVDELKSRLVDSAQVARIMDHLENIEDHFRRIEEHLKNSDAFDQESFKDRNDLRYRMTRLEERQGVPAQPGNPGPGR